MTRQENFMVLLKKHNYQSLNSFCLDNHLQQTNFSKRLRDENMKVDLLILFKLANILHEPIETLIDIFYPEELKENRSLTESK